MLTTYLFRYISECAISWSNFRNFLRLRRQGGIDSPNQNPADVPVCQRTPRVIGVARYPWGTCLLDFQQFIFGTLLWSCVKYHVNFLRQVSSGLRTILTKIKLNVFFYFIEKHENDVSFFRYGVFLFSSHFTCVSLSSSMSFFALLRA